MKPKNNGWEFTVRLRGTPQQYYVIKKGNKVHTSKDRAYLEKIMKR